MKRLTKFGLATIAVILLAGVFTLGVYAASNWLNFTGDTEIAETQDNIDELVLILEAVHEDKITAEEALAELEALNPPGLANKIKDLEAEITRLEAKIEQLKSELADKIVELTGKQQEIEDKQNEINEKNEIIDQKDTVIDGLITENEQKDNYIIHLESELERANQKATEVYNKSEEAVIEARNYLN